MRLRKMHGTTQIEDLFALKQKGRAFYIFESGIRI